MYVGAIFCSEECFWWRTYRRGALSTKNVVRRSRSPPKKFSWIVMERNASCNRVLKDAAGRALKDCAGRALKDAAAVPGF